MSSTWQILCVSHDPAIVAADDIRTSERAIELCAGIDEHPGCELLIVRYSGGLAEIGCPPSRTPHKASVGPTHSGFHPHHTEWVDVVWLRLLAAAYRATGADALVDAAADRIRGCWMPARVGRLAKVLDLDGLVDHG